MAGIGKEPLYTFIFTDTPRKHETKKYSERQRERDHSHGTRATRKIQSEINILKEILRLPFVIIINPKQL